MIEYYSFRGAPNRLKNTTTDRLFINNVVNIKIVRPTLGEPYNLHIYSSRIFRLEDVRPGENMSPSDDVKAEVTSSERRLQACLFCCVE